MSGVSLMKKKKYLRRRYEIELQKKRVKEYQKKLSGIPKKERKKQIGYILFLQDKIMKNSRYM